MATTSLLSMPTELLDRIWSYLDWDPSESLVPHRPDIINISLTCRHLRESIVPLLFQHAVLKLRWVDGALIEPALYRLRTYRPHLACHVRSVYIKTEFTQYVDPEFVLKGFAVPDELSDWVNPAALPDNPDYKIEHLHRQRVTAVAQTLFEGFEKSTPQLPLELKARMASFLQHIFGRETSESAFPTLTSCTWPSSVSQGSRKTLGFDSVSNFTLEEDLAGGSVHLPRAGQSMVVRRNDHLPMELQMDALVLIMLCLPATVTSLAFQSHPRGRMDIVRNGFALHVAVAACRIFGDRLQRLSMITSPQQGQRYTRLNSAQAELDMENAVVTSDALSNLTKLNTLVLSDQQGAYGRHRGWMSDNQVQWHDLAATVVHLELWNAKCGYQETLHFIKGFELLQSLHLNTIWLDESNGPPLPRQHRQVNNTVWLKFLIELRRDLPNLDMRLAQLHGAIGSESPLLGPSAIHWLTQEAVPKGCLIGYDRETRLTEDFESFIDLWTAEDSARGDEARESRKDGSLVDAAMTNRWKTFAHLR